jgi:4-amino-4-deoxy-L-arabinose transferase-like glycosyltransferase
LYTEVIALFFLVAASYYFILSIKSNKIKFLIIAAFFFAAGVYVKPLIQFYFGFAIFFLLFLFRVTWRQRVQYVVVLFLSVLILFAPWQLRNLHLTGQYAISTSSENWFPKMMYTIDGLKKGILRNDAAKILNDKMEEENQDLNADGIVSENEKRIFKKNYAIRYLFNNRSIFTFYNIKGMFQNMTTLGAMDFYDILYLPSSRTYTPAEKELTKGFLSRIKNYLFFYRPVLIPVLFVGFSILLITEYFLCGIVLIDLIRRKRIILVLFVIAMIFHIPFIAGLGPAPRMRMLVMPVIDLLAASGAYQLFRKLKNHST